MAKRSCYNCPRTAEIERLRDICLRCKSANDCDRNGRHRFTPRTVSIDAMKRGDGDGILGRCAVMPRHGSADETHTQLPPEVETRLRDRLAAFQGLSFVNKILVVWLMGGGSLAEFSRMEWLPKGVKPKGTISRQAVRMHIRTLKRQMPELDGFISSMVRLNSGARGEESRTRQKNRKCLEFRRGKHG